MNGCTAVQQLKTSTLKFTPVHNGLLQRKCACGGSPGLDGECAECRKKRLSLQRHSANGAEPSTVPPIVHEVLHSPGQPLDSATRTFMEPRFGHDFSQVRVHNDAKAAESTRAVNALAYTVGRNVVFGEGQYSPTTLPGQRLLAHELMHVVQQTGIHAKLEIGSVGDAYEREADRVGEQVMQGKDTDNINKPRVAIRPVQQLPGLSFKLQRRVVDDNAHVTCRPTRPGAVATLQTAESDAISVALRAALQTRLRLAFHPLVSVIGETPNLATFRDILWRRFHFDYNDATVRETLLPIFARRFELVADWISRLPHRYRCSAPGTEPAGECTTRPDEGLAWTATGVNETDLCDDFWDELADEQAGTIMHEWLHFGFDWLGDCEVRNRNNTVCYEMFARELVGTATPEDFADCCPPPAGALPPLAGAP